MEKIISLLKEKNLTISSAESFTGGSFASNLTDVSGASSVYQGSIVCYSNEVKTNVLHVEKEIIDEFGAVSAECAYSMAKHCQEIFKTDLAISFTGNAGPNASEGKEVGLLFIGLAYKNNVVVDKLNLKGDRLSIKKESILYALNKIYDTINK